METREKSRRNVTDMLNNEDASQSADTSRVSKDGAGGLKANEKSDVDLVRILQEIQEFRHENKQQLDVIREDICNTNKRIEEAEDRIEAAEARLQTMEQVMRNVLKTQAENAHKLVDQEARARRENIRIFGVPEDEERGTPVAVFVEKLLREKLNIPASLELSIERAHRTLAPKPTDAGKPRSIVVKFLHYRVKEQILRKAWEQKEVHVNNQRIYFDHDYPKAILNSCKEYNEAKRVLREKKIRFQTPYPSKLRVFYEDGTRLYQTANEAMKGDARPGLCGACGAPSAGPDGAA